MSLLAWDKTKYSVGIESIDEQHKKLINILNDLHDAMKEGKGREQINKTLSDLIEYTKTHFAYEEDLMKIHKYGGDISHKKDHSELIKAINQFQKRLNEGSITLTIEVKDFLRNWLLDHIGKRDKELGQFLASKDVK